MVDKASMALLYYLISKINTICAKDCHSPHEALDNDAGLFTFVKLRLPRFEQAAQVVHPLCGLYDKTFAQPAPVKKFLKRG